VVAALRAAENGTLFHVFVSAGKRYQDPSDNGTLGQPTLPAWLWDPRGINGGATTALTPDIVVVHGWAPGPAIAPPLPTTPGVSITVADTCMGQWNTSRSRVCTKQDGYASIVPHLRRQGWKVNGFSYGASMPDPRSGPDVAALCARALQAGSAAALVPCPPPQQPWVEGWACGYDSIGVLSIGTTGELFWSTTAVLGVLGLPPRDADRTLRALHSITLAYVSPLFDTRRHLDAGSTPPTHTPHASPAVHTTKTSTSRLPASTHKPPSTTPSTRTSSQPKPPRTGGRGGGGRVRAGQG
jgi:hypothetical protein